jgi:tetratricopeptide (TPR) repeat protein
MSTNPEIVSLLGVPKHSTPAVGDALAKLEAELAEAYAALSADPSDLEAHIMYGRRLAYLWRYRDAIKTYTAALERFGEDAMLYRHRGHRLISVRDFAGGARDLLRASDIKADDFDIWYHLGLAYWLLGEYGAARRAYEAFLPQCADDEQRIAITYWLYMTLRRLGEHEEAAALAASAGQPPVQENVHYLDLLRLFRGDRTESEIRELAKESDLAAGTLVFGLGCWHLLAGRTDEARSCFDEVVSGAYWPAFGFIAAEVELARLGCCRGSLS